jgi:hypothetical protein
MLTTVALLLLAATAPAEQSTMPRQQDANPVDQRPVQQERPTDPLFARAPVATDDPAFVLTTIESARQGVADARAAGEALSPPQLRDAATKIARQNETTLQRLEMLAKRKGWRLPEGNPDRATSLPDASPDRSAANFIIHQISFHESTLAQFRAQLGGNGDADLKRALRESLPGYQQNLELLLRLKL